MDGWLWTYALPISLLGLLEGILWVLAGRLGKRLGDSQGNSRKTLVSWVRMGLVAVFIGANILLGESLLSPQVRETFNDVWKVFTQNLVVSGNTHISLLTILWIIPVLYLSAKIGSWVKTLTEKVFSQAQGITASRIFGLSSFLKYLAMTLAGIFGLGLLGIDLTALGLFFSVLGVGLGLGLQDVVKNFFAGLVIIFSQPFKEDDLITVGGITGRVERLKLLSTVIVTGGNESLIVPNSTLVNGPVQNYSFRDRQSFIWTRLKAAYGTDIDFIYRVLLQIGDENPYRVPTTDTSVQTVELGDSGIVLELGLWARDVGEKRALQSWNFNEILSRFAKEGIVIPYPHIIIGSNKEVP